MADEWIDSAFTEGEIARSNGESLAENPYEEHGIGRFFWKSWNAGWADRDQTLNLQPAANGDAS